MPTTIICTKCGAERILDRGSGLGLEKCATCIKSDRDALYLSRCPKLYQQTDISRLPQRQLASAMAWVWGPRGLILIGETGKGKTRIAWTLLKRVITEDEKERSFAWFDCIAFGHAIAQHYKDDDAEKWLSKIASVGVLFLDDLGKLKLTERAEAELFGLVERRCADMLPIIVTTNDTGDSLAARMTENRGPALMRRLREFCDVIVL